MCLLIVFDYSRSRGRFRICMIENAQFSITVNLTDHKGLSKSTSLNNDLTIACFYFILLMPF